VLQRTPSHHYLTQAMEVAAADAMGRLPCIPARRKCHVYMHGPQHQLCCQACTQPKAAHRM